MIYELRTYTLQPGKQGEYLKHNSEIGRPIRGDKFGKLEGSWTTEFGTLNQYVHLWAYADLVERERLRAELAKNEAWSRDYVPKIRPLLLAQENKILSAQLPAEAAGRRRATSTSSGRTAVRWARPGSGSATSRRSCRCARSTRRTSEPGRRRSPSSTRSCTSGRTATSTIGRPSRGKVAPGSGVAGLPRQVGAAAPRDALDRAHPGSVLADEIGRN